MIYGYARVSTNKQMKDGNSLEAQIEALKAAGAEVIYTEAYTGTKASRPEFDKLMSKLKENDTLIVTKLDRFARSTIDGTTLVRQLIERGVIVHVLNIGIMDNSPGGRLITTVFLAFAEFERDLIIERTAEGKERARQNPGYKDGRPKKYSESQIEHALELLKQHSTAEVSKMTGISKATLFRMKKEFKSTTDC